MNPMQQLDAGNRDRRVSEVLQSQHRPQTPFHPAVILLDDIVEILARADRDGSQLSILGPKLANGPMGGLVSVDGDRVVIVRGTRPCCLEGFPEKRFGGGHVTFAAQAEIDRLTAGIHGTIEGHPAATNLDVRLIHAHEPPTGRAKRFQRFSNSGA
jgi:hypothetical protein